MTIVSQKNMKINEMLLKSSSHYNAPAFHWKSLAKEQNKKYERSRKRDSFTSQLVFHLTSPAYFPLALELLPLNFPRQNHFPTTEIHEPIHFLLFEKSKFSLITFHLKARHTLPPKKGQLENIAAFPYFPICIIILNCYKNKTEI